MTDQNESAPVTLPANGPSTSAEPNAPLSLALRLVLAAFAVVFPGLASIYCCTPPWSSPNVLIMKMCCLVIALVLCLWILDAAAILHFSREWMSKTIWAVAIAGILTAAVTAFKNQITSRAFPLQGPWRVELKWNMEHGKQVAGRTFDVILAGTDAAGVYAGLSLVNTWIGDYSDSTWIELPRLSVEESSLHVLYRNTSGAKPILDLVINVHIDSPAESNTRITGHLKDVDGDEYDVAFVRR